MYYGYYYHGFLISLVNYHIGKSKNSDASKMLATPYKSISLRIVSDTGAAILDLCDKFLT